MSLHYDYYNMFYYVGKFGNLTQAAEALYLSPSTVSRAMQSLEAELGCVLLERTRSGILLTDAGKELYDHVANACAEINRGEAKLARIKSTRNNVLRIGVSDLSFDRLVLPTICRFSGKHPNVCLSIVSSGYHYADEVCRSLISGKTDLACTAAAAFGAEQDGLVHVDKVARYSDILIAGEPYYELKEGVFRLTELKDYPFAVPAIETSDITETERLFQAAGIRLLPRVRTDSILMLTEILRVYPCIAVVPSLLRDTLLRDDKLFEVHTSDQLQTHDICVLTAIDPVFNPLREAFIQELIVTVQQLDVS